MNTITPQNYHNRSAKIEIDYIALLDNFKIIRAQTHSLIYAVVKANSYGHGSIKCVLTLNEYADGFAVATIDEASSIKPYVNGLPILIFQGFSCKNELKLCIKNNFIPVVYSYKQLIILSTAKLAAKPKIFIKFNSGMGRLGFDAKDIDDIKLIIDGKFDYGIMSHLCCADDKKSTKTTEQIKNFKKICANFNSNIQKSLANSAGIFSQQESHFDIVRPGVSLYGISPFNVANQPKLKPVMSFKAKIMAVYERNKNQSIGYGATYICHKKTTIAVINAGYADGYPRVLNDKTYCFINGKKNLIVGRVSMDSICIKVDTGDVKVGDDVVLWGKEIAIEDVARSAGTIGYELSCRAGGLLA